MLQALHNTLAGDQTDQVGIQVNDQVKRLAEALGQGEKAAAELMQTLGLRHAPTFRKNYLTRALEAEFLERTQSDSPRSPRQCIHEII